MTRQTLANRNHLRQHPEDETRRLETGLLLRRSISARRSERSRIYRRLLVYRIRIHDSAASSSHIYSDSRTPPPESVGYFDQFGKSNASDPVQSSAPDPVQNCRGFITSDSPNALQRAAPLSIVYMRELKVHRAGSHKFIIVLSASRRRLFHFRPRRGCE